MSLTVNSRPATWAGTSNPIIYKMTTTDHANAGYYLLVEIWNSTTGLKIGSQKCYPNSAGLLSVRVESILRSNMSLDNNSSFFGQVDVSTSVDNNWIKYYIKYNQYWTGSSPALINDVANLRYAIYGGIQLFAGYDNNFAAYIIAAFPTVQSIWTSMRGQLFSCSVISNVTNAAAIVRKYLDGVLIGTSGSILDSSPSDNKINRVGIYELIADRVDLVIGDGLKLRNPNTPWVNVGVNSFTFGDNTFTYVVTTLGGKNYGATDTFVCNSGVTLTIVCIVDKFGSFSGPDPQVYFQALGAADVVSGQSNIVDIVSSNGVYTFTLVTTAPILKIKVLSANAGSSSSGTLIIITNYLNPTLGMFIGTNGDEYSEIKKINMLDDCSNIIVLQWKNSLGGDECYPFIYNQEYTFDYGGGKKAKRVTMTALGLSLDQWEAIDGLNTIGEAYKTPITELTTTLNRTMATIGQSVYVLNSDGTKIGVTVINVQNTTQTKQVRHQATVTIEYPELFLQ